MTYLRGAVVWSTDPFRGDSEAGRPWLVLNTDAQPFHDQQSMTVALSTSGHDGAVSIGDGDWIDGGLPRQSYALPWAIHSLAHRDVDDHLGRLNGTVVDEVVSRLETYVRSS